MYFLLFMFMLPFTVNKDVYITQRVSVDNLQWNRIEYFAKQVTIVYYVVNNFTNRAPPIMSNLTMTMYDVKYVSWPA